MVGIYLLSWSSVSTHQSAHLARLLSHLVCNSAFIRFYSIRELDKCNLYVHIYLICDWIREGFKNGKQETGLYGQHFPNIS